MERDLDGHLRSLLSILKDKKPGSSITSFVNPTTIHLIHQIFSREDYVSVAAQVTDASDAKDLLDFILYLLHRCLLTNPDGITDIKRRARRFMLKVTPAIPESLIVTGIRMPAEYDYIAGGAYGHVFKSELRGVTIALKILYKVDNINLAFCREALMWRSLNHDFVLPFWGICQEKHLFLVSPYMKNGTLAEWRKKANPSITDVEERILEVAKGLEYIHSEGVVHGDLRGENVLLNDNFHVQITDFGLTRVSEATNSGSRAKHFNFAAPELFGNCEDDGSEPTRTQQSDVYAFGCLYYEIHYNSIPFASKTDMAIVTLHSKGFLPPRLHEPPLSDEAWKLIQNCWVREALNRPKIEEVREKMVAMAISQSAVSIFTPDARDASYDALPRELEFGTPSPLSELAVEQTLRPPTPRALLTLTNEGDTEMTAMYSTLALCCPDPATCNSPCIHIHSLSASPDQSLSSSIISYNTAASSVTPPSPANTRSNSGTQQSQSRHQSGLPINAQDSSYETPPRSLVATLTSSAAPPSDKKDLSAILKAKLEHYSSPNFGNLKSKFSAIQQSDENIDALTVWQNVTLNPRFKPKNEELYKLYYELLDKAKYDGTKIVLKPLDAVRIRLMFTLPSSPSK